MLCVLIYATNCFTHSFCRIASGELSKRALGALFSRPLQPSFDLIVFNIVLRPLWPSVDVDGGVLESRSLLDGDHVLMRAAKTLSPVIEDSKKIISHSWAHVGTPS